MRRFYRGRIPMSIVDGCGLTRHGPSSPNRPRRPRQRLHRRAQVIHVQVRVDPRRQLGVGVAEQSLGLDEPDTGPRHARRRRVPQRVQVGLLAVRVDPRDPSALKHAPRCD